VRTPSPLPTQALSPLPSEIVDLLDSPAIISAPKTALEPEEEPPTQDNDMPITRKRRQSKHQSNAASNAGETTATTLHKNLKRKRTIPPSLLVPSGWKSVANRKNKSTLSSDQRTIVSETRGGTKKTLGVSRTRPAARKRYTRTVWVDLAPIIAASHRSIQTPTTATEAPIPDQLSPELVPEKPAGTEAVQDELLTASQMLDQLS